MCRLSTRTFARPLYGGRSAEAKLFRQRRKRSNPGQRPELAEHTLPRLAVFAERFPDSWVGTALREHREDRDGLLASLLESLRGDSRVRAAWMWGSFGKGEADDLSDLDPWLLVEDAAVGEMGASLLSYARRTGNFISGGESTNNAPADGGYFSSLHEGRHGLLHVDCYWQGRSAGVEIPETALLFDRLNAPTADACDPPLVLPTSTEPTDDGQGITRGIGFTWLMLSIAAKYLARDPQSDMSLMLYPEPGFEEAAALLGLADVASSTDWSIPERCDEKVDRLRHLVGETAQLTTAAIGRGLDLSPTNALCMERYLDLVAGIVNSNRGR